METQPGVCRCGLSIGPTCSSIPRVSMASARGMSRQSRPGLPMSTVIALAPARATSSRPPAVSRVACSRPLRLQDQPADAAGGVAALLDLAAVGVPDAHEGVGPGGGLDGDELVAADAAARGRRWRAPPPALGAKGALRASTTTKSLPSPFIFRNGRLMGIGI